MNFIGGFTRLNAARVCGAFFFALVFAMLQTACTNPEEEKPEGAGLAETYKNLYGDSWYGDDGRVLGSVSLDDDALSAPGMKFSGVYTSEDTVFEGGDTHGFTGGHGGTWAYIYGDDGKLGIAIYSISTKSVLFLGKHLVTANAQMFGELGINVDADNMQDGHSGTNANWNKRYAVCVTALNQFVSLPGLQGTTITGVDAIGTDKWLTVTPGPDAGGVPAVDVRISEWRTTGLVADGGTAVDSAAGIPPAEGKGSVIINGADGTRLLFVVTQAHTEQGAMAEAGDFITDWETVNTVNLVTREGDPIKVNLPWASQYSVTFLPEMRKDMKKVSGWQMAFCLFGDESAGQQFNYFGLYNKYTGTLRVYYYQPTVTSGGGELSILVTPTKYTNQKVPYYHSWQYGIPVNHADVNTRANPYNISANTNETFQTIVTPYSAGDKMTLGIGWYAFDLDFTSYKDGQIFGDGEGLQFNGLTQTNSDVSLTGAITANIDGKFDYTFTDPKAPQHTPNGTLGWFSDIIGGGSGNGGLAKAIFDAGAGNYLGMGADLIGAGLNVAAKHAGKDTDAEDGKGNGNISLTLTGKLSLQGYIKTATSNDFMNAGFEYSKPVNSTNVQTLGAVQPIQPGVWSLQTDPVVCVVNDAILMEEDTTDDLLGMTSDQRDGYPPFKVWYLGGNYDTQDRFQLRMIYFLDPSSIKINLNTALYKNISDVQVTWQIGVYPNQPAGHSNYIRSTIGVPKIGNLSEVQDTAWFPLLKMPFTTDYQSQWLSDSKSLATRVIIKRDDLLSVGVEGVLDGATSGCNTYSWNSPLDAMSVTTQVYGKAISGRDGSSDQFILDPQVSLPVSYGGVWVDPLPPDFAVWVTVSFKYVDDDGKEQNGLFNKRFLPDIKVISKDDLKNTYKTQINDYKSKAQSGAALQTINGVKIVHKDNDKMLYKIGKVIDKLSEAGAEAGTAGNAADSTNSRDKTPDALSGMQDLIKGASR